VRRRRTIRRRRRRRRRRRKIFTPKLSGHFALDDLLLVLQIEPLLRRVRQRLQTHEASADKGRRLHGQIVEADETRQDLKIENGAKEE
jgi:hypothetical protein